MTIRNNTFKKMEKKFIPSEIRRSKQSFAHLTSRKFANQYMFTKNYYFKAPNDRELYVLDEAYGEYARNYLL